MKKNRTIKKPTIYNEFTVGMMLTFYELMDMCPEFHVELYVENGAIYYDN